MKAKRLSVIVISAVLLFLSGCSSEPYVAGQNNEKKEVESKETTLTVKVEQVLTGRNYHYRFSGFTNEDTILFESAYHEKHRQVYHLAKKGYTFEFEEISGWQFEIVDVNRQEGWVTLKTMKK